MTFAVINCSTQCINTVVCLASSTLNECFTRRLTPYFEVSLTPDNFIILKLDISSASKMCNETIQNVTDMLNETLVTVIYRGNNQQCNTCPRLKQLFYTSKILIPSVLLIAVIPENFAPSTMVFFCPNQQAKYDCRMVKPSSLLEWQHANYTSPGVVRFTGLNEVGKWINTSYGNFNASLTGNDSVGDRNMFTSVLTILSVEHSMNETQLICQGDHFNDTISIFLSSKSEECNVCNYYH